MVAFARQVWELHRLIEIVVVMVLAGVVAWTAGADKFEQTFKVSPLYQHGERASLVVFAVSLVAAFVALFNVIKVLATGRTLGLDIPHWLDTWLWTFGGISVGILIGTTIFR